MSLKRNTFAEAKPLTNLLDAVQRLREASSDERLVLNYRANYGCLKLVMTALS
jgi:hypothetical protein